MAAHNKADSPVVDATDSKPARVPFIRRLPAAAAGAPVVTAAVAVAGVVGITAASLALSSQAATHAGGQPVNPTRTAHSAAPHATYVGKHRTATKAAAPRASTHTVTAHKAAVVHKSTKSHTTLTTYSKPKTVSFTVQAGDTLSSISGQFYGNQSDWPVLYYANQSGLSSPNEITVGQVLEVPPLPATIPAAPASAVAAPSSSTSSAASSSSTASESEPASTSTSTASQSDSSVDASDYSGFQQCVIERESGGDSQVMNSSGHYGLYQFSASTWAAYGGNPADFGDASVAEQNQVFDNAMAAGGESNWAPYDGC